MKLDRNVNLDGKGKYALVLLRNVAGGLPSMMLHPISNERCFLIPENALDFGESRENEFFVIRLKDKYASAALDAYAKACVKDDAEYAHEIIQLASRAATHPLTRKPD